MAGETLKDRHYGFFVVRQVDADKHVTRYAETRPAPNPRWEGDEIPVGYVRLADAEAAMYAMHPGEAPELNNLRVERRFCPEAIFIGD